MRALFFLVFPIYIYGKKESFESSIKITFLFEFSNYNFSILSFFFFLVFYFFSFQSDRLALKLVRENKKTKKDEKRKEKGNSLNAFGMRTGKLQLLCFASRERGRAKYSLYMLIKYIHTYMYIHIYIRMRGARSRVIKQNYLEFLFVSILKPSPSALFSFSFSFFLSSPSSFSSFERHNYEESYFNDGHV